MTTQGVMNGSAAQTSRTGEDGGMPRQSPTLARALENPCPIIRSLGVLSDTWSFLVVREAFLGARTFVQLRDRLHIAPDVLSARLGSLVEHGVLERTPYQEPGQRTRDAYDLTAAGRELKVVMVAMEQWGDAHVPHAPTPRMLPVTTETGERVRAALVDPEGAVLPEDEVTFVRSDRLPTGRSVNGSAT